MRGRIDVDLFGGGSCTAVSVTPATDADHASVYARAQCDCAGKDPNKAAALALAEQKDPELIALDNLTTVAMKLLAQIHKHRMAAQERIRKSIEKGSES